MLVELSVFSHLTYLAIFQELQRRLDQTLGKPGNYHHGVDREGHIKPMTIGARLYRLENQVEVIEAALLIQLDDVLLFDFPD